MRARTWKHRLLVYQFASSTLATWEKERRYRNHSGPDECKHKRPGKRKCWSPYSERILHKVKWIWQRTKQT